MTVALRPLVVGGPTKPKQTKWLLQTILTACHEVWWLCELQMCGLGWKTSAGEREPDIHVSHGINLERFTLASYQTPAKLIPVPSASAVRRV